MILQIVAEVAAGTVCDVQYSLKQLIVSLLQQLIEVWHVRCRAEAASLAAAGNASTRWRSVAVMNPLHAGDAYVSRDTTTARKTASRPISVMPWWRSAYSDCALSPIIRRICSDADNWSRGRCKIIVAKQFEQIPR